jgi:hypothetical protein
VSGHRPQARWDPVSGCANIIAKGSMIECQIIDDHLLLSTYLQKLYRYSELIFVFHSDIHHDTFSHYLGHHCTD